MSPMWPVRGPLSNGWHDSAETLAAGETRLRAGIATTFEVLQFQRDLGTAAISEIRAMADYNIAVARYHQATVTTRARHGITLAQ